MLLIDKILDSAHHILFLYRNYKLIKSVKKAPIPKESLNKTEERVHKVIVSLTSYPKRFKYLHLSIKTILNQTIKPDRIILYLFEDDKKYVTSKLKKLQNHGLTIKYVKDDIRPHKKYFYAMQEFPSDLIITVDDDLLYESTLIESLYNAYKTHPDCVCARRVHRMLKKNGTLLNYNDWEHECKSILEPSLCLFATTGAGTLFPPNSLPKDAFNIQTIKNNCLNADDVYSKFMQIKNNTRVFWVINSKPMPNEIVFAQKTALKKTNIQQECMNDVYINKMETLTGIKLANFC